MKVAPRGVVKDLLAFERQPRQRSRDGSRPVLDLSYSQRHKYDPTNSKLLKVSKLSQALKKSNIYLL
jgi:hypothetical protein